MRVCVAGCARSELLQTCRTSSPACSLQLLAETTSGKQQQRQRRLCLQVIPPAWLRLFNPREVNQVLAGGEGGGLDVADMRAHARYSGGYHADSASVKLFWKARPISELCPIP